MKRKFAVIESPSMIAVVELFNGVTVKVRDFLPFSGKVLFTGTRIECDKFYKEGLYKQISN